MVVPSVKTRSQRQKGAVNAAKTVVKLVEGDGEENLIIRTEDTVVVSSESEGESQQKSINKKDKARKRAMRQARYRYRSNFIRAFEMTKSFLPKVKKGVNPFFDILRPMQQYRISILFVINDSFDHYNSS